MDSPNNPYGKGLGIYAECPSHPLTSEPDELDVVESIRRVQHPDRSDGED